MKTHKKYIVGGHVRDTIMGIKSKDIDYAFEFSKEFIKKNENLSVADFYKEMNKILTSEGFTIFLETPHCFTTRAKFPEDHKHNGTTADFVLCRREVYDDPNSRKPTVSIASLYEDQKRRDFTVNSIAFDEDNNTYIDPFKGIEDIFTRKLKCPVDALTSFSDDPLRILRALRFNITKGFSIDDELMYVILRVPLIWDKLDKVVSKERIRDEMFKMFKFDTLATFSMLERLKKEASFDVMGSLFPEGMWLEPTFKR